MKRVSKRGIGNICGYVLKFMNLMHVSPNVTGTYGEYVLKEGAIEDGKGLGAWFVLQVGNRREIGACL